MENFLTILALVWSIFSIILFVKIWIMTNDIRKIRDTLNGIIPHQSTDDVATTKPIGSSFKPAVDAGIMLKGSILRLKSGEFAYYGIFDGKHALYPMDESAKESICNHSKTITDNSGENYLALSDREFKTLVKKYKA